MIRPFALARGDRAHRRVRPEAIVLVVVLAVLASAACASPEPSVSPTPLPSPNPAASTDTPMSTDPPPTLGPQSPPAPGKVSPPSDPQPVDVVVGRIVRGGSGPCYGLETDDGKLYAIYSTTAGDLPAGTTVRVKTKPLLLKIYCGEGEHVAAVSVETLR